MEQYTSHDPHQFLQGGGEQWQPVSLRYVRVLQVRLLMVTLPLLIAIAVVLNDAIPLQYIVLIEIVLLLVVIIAGLVFLPRKVRYTRYLLRDLDVNLQKGFLFRHIISLAINRIQHLEVTQNPVERSLQLSRIVIYTAGGYQSDLTIPGLESNIAIQIKQQLLKQIAAEEFEN